MSLKGDDIIRDCEIMNAHGNQASDIVWEIAINYSRAWAFGERAKLAWQILRGRGRA